MEALRNNINTVNMMYRVAIRALQHGDSHSAEVVVNNRNVLLNLNIKSRKQHKPQAAY